MIKKIETVQRIRILRKKEKKGEIIEQ